MNMIWLNKKYFAPVLLVIFCGSMVGAAPETENQEVLTPEEIKIEEQLRLFSQEPQVFMKKIPRKNYSKSGQKKSRFSYRSILHKDFIDAKIKYRPKNKSWALKQYNDDPQSLVDNAQKMLTTLGSMDRKKLKTAELKVQPWSDTWWPLFVGSIAWRYADPSFPSDSDWKKNFEYVWLGPIFKLGEFLTSVQYDTLSPAEKYDLLVGDTERHLTRAALRSGEEIYESEKKVDEWMGICHGWAPASYSAPRPEKVVTLTAVDGKTKINFYPSDIKALTSYIWATNSFKEKFIGGRCNVKEPKLDDNGRITDQECFDTNPAAWHIAVVNQIGVSQRSMVMDATFDFEVWNQPILSYSYTYFNPLSKKVRKTLKAASIPVKEFKDDKFARYRSPKAESIVGIAMKLTYIVENSPSQHKTNSPSQDSKTSVEYIYDLELDAKGQIIGGEWYQNAHPDFLWTPEVGAQPISRHDRNLDFVKEAWDGNSALPMAWADVAKVASQQDGVPLLKVVQTLQRLSQNKVQ